MPERLAARHAHPTPHPRARPTATAPDTGPGVLLRLQRSAGNRAVAALLEHGHPLVQRVEVKDKPYSETLYDKSGTAGKAGANKYSLTPAYVLDRNGDSGLKVTVRVQFLNQPRAADGSYSADATEIPVNDPDDRRGWAQKLVKEQVKPWNGHVTLTGEEVNVFSGNTKKRLPVTFESVAVFGKDDPHDNIVIIHPSSVVAGTPGQKIDAGNYYVNKGAYTGDEKIIAAHEYGHLIGIPDEYSQSNEQMNALLHQAAPKTAPSAQAALDKKTVERMVLAAMQVPLVTALDSAMASVTDALRAKRAAVKKAMAAAARAGARDASVTAELEQQLTASAEPGLAAAVPKTVAFQTTKNFSNKDLADKTVEAGFDAGALTTLIHDKYSQALAAADKANVVAVTGLGDVSINVKQSVRNTTAAGGAQAAAGATAASSLMGGPGGPVNLFGFVLNAPPSGLIGKLMGIPATWGSAGSALESGVSAAAFSAKMAAVLKAAGAAAAFVAMVPGLAGPKIAKMHALYVKAHQMVNSAAVEAARQLSADLLNSVIPPVITAGVTDVQTSIHSEVEKIMATTPSGLAAFGDPTMTAMVTAMKARLDADKTASAGGGRDPLGTGKATPDQDVTYSYQGLMGTHGNLSVRPDQLAPLVAQFNAHCRNMWEKSFTAEVK